MFASATCQAARPATHCEELMANPKSTTPVIIVKQLKISSTGVLGTISPLPTVVTCILSTALGHKLL